ncbi:MAG: HDOD domain-containing protein [Myxococcus sp.]|nr:HDOD domain-containing protein [Myxococcus sp.]
MRRVLFVDDEQSLLDGLANSLRRFRSQWQMSFACGGRAGLERLAAEPFDAVVSDFRMPGIDGEALLRAVQAHHPDTVRIILSGENDDGRSLRLLDLAHQFLAKPWESKLLFEAVERACARRAALASPAVRALVTQVGAIPALPATNRRLVELLARPDASMPEVAAVIETDPALTAKVLQLVNTAFFGVPQRLVRVLPAARSLGVEPLRALTSSAGAFDEAGGNHLVEHLTSTRPAHAAAIARALAPPGPIADLACAACLLRDVGQWLLAARHGEAWLPLVRARQGSAERLESTEASALGCDHAQVGAYLLALWGLPQELVAAVASHHGPVAPFDGALTAEQCVFLATAVVDGAPEDAIERAGLGGQLERARELAVSMPA